MSDTEKYKKDPIYGTDFSKPASVIVSDLRNQLTQIRGQFFDIKTGFPIFKDIIKNMDGFLTTGIASLYHSIKEIQEIEIRADDSKYGKSLKFGSRGIGLDVTPGCFVCGTKIRSKAAAEIGNEYLNNIAAFAENKLEGEEIVSWFDSGAFLDWRKHEPNWIQVKIGACDKHLPNLEQLHQMTLTHNVIRKHMIEEAKK
jgi:hypothetical protein